MAGEGAIALRSQPVCVCCGVAVWVRTRTGRTEREVRSDPCDGCLKECVCVMHACLVERVLTASCFHTCKRHQWWWAVGHLSTRSILDCSARLVHLWLHCLCQVGPVWARGGGGAGRESVSKGGGVSVSARRCTPAACAEALLVLLLPLLFKSSHPVAGHVVLFLRHPPSEQTTLQSCSHQSVPSLSLYTECFLQPGTSISLSASYCA